MWGFDVAAYLLRYLALAFLRSGLERFASGSLLFCKVYLAYCFFGRAPPLRYYGGRGAQAAKR